MPAITMSPSTASSVTLSRGQPVGLRSQVASLKAVWIEGNDPIAKLQAEFNEWLSDIAMNKQLFETHVHKNPDLSDFDLHQHRARLFALLANGEQLIVSFYSVADKLNPSSYFRLIEENLEALLIEFNTWHGPAEAQEDIPEDFKESIRDIREGNIVDLEQILTEKPFDAAGVQGA